MSRFLLDMGLAQSTGEHLRSLGHDVVHLRDQGLERLPDDRIVMKARQEHRAIITHDLDFGRIVTLCGSTVQNVISLRLTDMTPARVNTALGSVLREASAAIEQGALVTVTDQGIRVRRLPVDSR